MCSQHVIPGDTMAICQWNSTLLKTNFTCNILYSHSEKFWNFVTFHWIPIFIVSQVYEINWSMKDSFCSYRKNTECAIKLLLHENAWGFFPTFSPHLFFEKSLKHHSMWMTLHKNDEEAIIIFHICKYTIEAKKINNKNQKHILYLTVN